MIAAQPQVDILINGLGIYGAREFFDIEDALWDEYFQVNIMSGVRLSRHYAQGVIASNLEDVIVNLTG